MPVKAGTAYVVGDDRLYEATPTRRSHQAVPAHDGRRPRHHGRSVRRPRDDRRSLRGHRPGRHRRSQKDLRVPPREAGRRRRHAPQRILSSLARMPIATGRRSDDRHADGLLSSAGRKTGRFERGIETALQFILASPEFLFRFETDPPTAASHTALSGGRSRAGVAAVVLPVEQHPGRSAADAGGPGQAEGSGCPRAAGQAHAGGSRARRRWSPTSPSSGCTCAT